MLAYTMPRVRCCLALASAGFLAGCSIPSGACTYQTRVAALDGDLAGTVAGRPDSGRAVVTLSVLPPYRDLTIAVHTWMAGAIATAELRGAQGQVLATVSGGNASAGDWSGYLRLAGATPSVPQLYRLARTGNLEVVVRVGPGANGELRGKLTQHGSAQWTRPTCD